MNTTTITIVMVITTMLDCLFPKFYNFVYTFVSGIISGLTATYLYRRQSKKIERTNIQISPQIARSRNPKDSDGYQYTIKISNDTPQDAYDVRLYIRMRYNGKYLTIKPKSIPILHGNCKKYQPCDYQRTFTFRLSNFNERTIQSLGNDTLLDLYRADTLEFSHFDHPKTLVEIVVMSIDSISGGVMDVKITTFNNADLKNNVVDGKFHNDTLEISPDQDSNIEDFDDCNYQANVPMQF